MSADRCFKPHIYKRRTLWVVDYYVCGVKQRYAGETFTEVAAAAMIVGDKDIAERTMNAIKQTFSNLRD